MSDFVLLFQIYKKTLLEKQEINKIFESFRSLKALIIGDVMLDSYMWGKVNRISPEAPVPVVSVNRKENRLGGAANVALNIQALGATPILCASVGKDRAGELFLDLLKKQKLSAAGIVKSKNRITTIKTRVIGNNHQLLRVDEEIESDLSSSESKKLLDLISKIIGKEKIDVIIFEDYDKGLITEDLVEKVIRLARKKKIPTVVDPKKKNFHNYKGATLFKPNLKEFKEGAKVDFDHRDVKELKKAVDLFRNKQNIDTILITMSELGVFVNNGKVSKMIPAHIRSIADVSGAGDTVVSVAALCLALNLNPVVTASIANLAGGLVCEKVGVVPVDKAQLHKEMESINL